MTAVIIGGSIAGLTTALSLGTLGYDVRVIDRDPGVPPADVDDALRDWSRPTVPQARHSHAFASLGCNLLRQRTPEVYQALVSTGAEEIRLGERPPPTLRNVAPDPGDEELRMLACRRSTFEWVLRREVLRSPRVRFDQGTVVRGLELANGTGYRVTGVRTADQRVVKADLVIDAAGRRSPVTGWLADAGVPTAQTRSESCEILYYTRFYRLLADGLPGPLNRGFGAGGLWDHYTAVLFLGDNRTFSVSIGVLPDDTPMKALRNEAAFTAALQATPLLAPWVAPAVSEPISGVYAMGGLDNCLRGVATSQQATPVQGLHHIGDAVCTTNPAFGRGVSLAVAHAFRLADVVAAVPEPGIDQSREMARSTDELFTPWLADAVQNDRGRAALWRATVTGAPAAGPPDGAPGFGAMVGAAAVDPVIWRRLVRVMMMLEPPASLYGDQEMHDRVRAALSAGPLPEIPAPRREQLVDVVHAAAG